MPETDRRFTKIRYAESEGTVQLGYETRKGIDFEKSTFSSPATPEPMFVKTLRSFKDEFLRVLDLPKEYGENLEIYQISISYHNDTRGINITGKRKVSDLNSPFVPTTPYLPEPGENFTGGGMSSQLIELLDTLEQYAAAYLDGHRAQQELALDNTENGTEKKRRRRSAKQEDIEEQAKREPVFGQSVRLFEDKTTVLWITQVTSERLEVSLHNGTVMGYVQTADVTWNEEKDCWIAPKLYPADTEATATVSA